MRIANRPLLLVLCGVAVLSVVFATVFSFRATGARAADSSSQSVPLTRVGSASFASAGTATDFSTQANEIDTTVLGGDADNAFGGPGDDGGINRTPSGATTGNGRAVNPNAKPKSNPTLGTNFQGLNFFNQRFANGGNQFSVEPPDQGLCAGNGFVVESVNDVLRVFHTDGTAATGVVDLNTFYGYPAAIDRTQIVQGPFVTHPS